MAPIPKPEPRRREKARKKRAEAAVKAIVRDQVARRDGYCRLWGAPMGPCGGPSEWAHLGDKRRSKTVGMDPEERHTTADSFMACRRHHQRYDRKATPFMTIQQGAHGANGKLKFISEDGAVWQES